MRFPREAKRQYEQTTGKPIPYVHYILPNTPVAVGYIVATSPNVVLPDTLVKASSFIGFSTGVSHTYTPVVPGSRLFLITIVQEHGPSWIHWPYTDGVVRGILTHADDTTHTEGARRETERTLAKHMRYWRLMGLTNASRDMVERTFARARSEANTVRAIEFALSLAAALGGRLAAYELLKQRVQEQNLNLVREAMALVGITAGSDGLGTDKEVQNLAHAAIRALSKPR